MDVHNGLDTVTTLHWHGMHVPAKMDGGPHQLLDPGQTWSPQWQVRQPAATLWYHAHPHGQTADQVYKGVAGMILVEDPAGGPDLPDEYGVDDIPVIVQDKTFDSDGQLEFNQRGPSSTGFLGDTVMVNGTIGAYLDVPTTHIRLRLLNASTARIYKFGVRRRPHVRRGRHRRGPAHRARRTWTGSSSPPVSARRSSWRWLPGRLPSCATTPPTSAAGWRATPGSGPATTGCSSCAPHPTLRESPAAPATLADVLPDPRVLGRRDPHVHDQRPDHQPAAGGHGPHRRGRAAGRHRGLGAAQPRPPAAQLPRAHRAVPGPGHRRRATPAAPGRLEGHRLPAAGLRRCGSSRRSPTTPTRCGPTCTTATCCGTRTRA